MLVADGDVAPLGDGSGREVLQECKAHRIARFINWSVEKEKSIIGLRGTRAATVIKSRRHVVAFVRGHHPDITICFPLVRNFLGEVEKTVIVGNRRSDGLIFLIPAFASTQKDLVVHNRLTAGAIHQEPRQRGEA